MTELFRILHSRPLIRRRRASTPSPFPCVEEYVHKAIRACQSALKKEPAIIAHRPCKASGCSRVTVRSDKSKAEVRIGVDATDISEVLITCAVLIGDEEVEVADFAATTSPRDIGKEAANMVLDALYLSAP